MTDRDGLMPLEIVESFRAGAEWSRRGGLIEWPHLQRDAEHFAMTGEIRDRGALSSAHREGKNG
jgi:hypothetical protein